MSGTTRGELMPLVGSMEQVASIRRMVLDDGKGRGMRVMEVNNGSGLTFTVFPDRGMDIGAANYRGVPLAWLAPNGAVAPQFYEPGGIQWLRTWPGGLLTGCGLSNVGGPESAGGEDHGLHGRLSHLPAEEVNSSACWRDDSHYALKVSGTLRHTRVFGEKLTLTRSIATALGEDCITVNDTIENHGFTAVPLMLLYHINLGWPLIGAQARLLAPRHKVVPATEHAAAALKQWPEFSEPVPGFAEQVYFHTLRANRQGMAAMRLVNPEVGLELSVAYRVAELPHMIQWKMPGAGEYVLGLEPANCLPIGQNRNREQGELRMIEPGEVVETLVEIAVKPMG